jgi:hypothetical protein
VGSGLGFSGLGNRRIPRVLDRKPFLGTTQGRLDLAVRPKEFPKFIAVNASC